MSISKKLSWWTEARYGMSLHFGLYSLAGRGEWVRAQEQMSVEDYQRYFERFEPAPDWAIQWARLAKAAGAQYGVLTTKHHDGFCLFDSKLTDYSSMYTPAGRDLVREWVDAMRAEGLKVGLYYSLVDWHHPDYPAWQDRQHPLRHDSASEHRDRAANWDRYIEYMHGQLIELCSNYGVIDNLVVDFSYWQYTAEKWGATEIQNKLRALQPDMIFNDRWGREARQRLPRATYAGDYEQTEQNIPQQCLKDDQGERIPWEGWFTLTNSWSYSATDALWKSPSTIIRTLINCVSKDGNLLINVCPDGKGIVPAQAVDIMEEVGEWMRSNGESIYGAGASSYAKPEWGRYTQKGRTLYAHLTDQPIGNICLPGLRGRVKRGRIVATDTEVRICDYWNPVVQSFDGPDDIFFNFASPTAATYPLPDARATVVAFELNDDVATQQERERLDTAIQAAMVSRTVM
ncbi:alpha-L-fucosidase [Coraliomargarita algicola]|uniref:alpha-L-fucosidase n=1 Tax=Coraliomargarita algicola TaxID=3092156 RepID=A0ABZ0RK27_9BACT|nr:alpha-L-fucosidase [Coraliomargarita sp. J2-16]WPJ95619.1 alpha-L-fucosidase [Coraliomargarita sp. J2-16]